MIKRFPLHSETAEPPFEYVVLTDAKGRAVCLDYYLFDATDFDGAYTQLKAEFAKGNEQARLCKVGFNTRDRTFHLVQMFRCSADNKPVYCEEEEALLHVYFYINAGKWLNPNNKFGG